MQTVTTETERMIEATRRLVGELRAWSIDPDPHIGHASNSTAVRRRAAESSRRRARTIADRLEGLLDEPDRLESALMPHDLANDLANMDATERTDIRGARQDAFDAAIDRRNDREGICYIHGRRHRRTAGGGWEMY